MNNEFEREFYKALVDNETVSKPLLPKLKRAIKRQNSNFIEDVLKHNFKDSNKTMEQAANDYAKSFAREVNISKTNKIEFSKRILRTDLKESKIIEPEQSFGKLPVVELVDPVELKNDRFILDEFSNIRPQAREPKPTQSPKPTTKIQDNDDFEF